ncbi:MAG: rhomboid family intramembrane serine protease [Syntrophorhabdaceae bacterium]|nr:rhomboid family intramembrane serine protease [Syntrophorhabdaceae bacterium]
MIPIRDNIPTRIKPIITISIIFVNISIYLFQTFGLNLAERQNIFKYYGLIPKEFYSSLYVNYELLPYNVLTLFTSMFIHGSFIHLGGNMLYLWIFGNNIEDSMGHKRFVLFYLLSGIVAALFQLLYDPLSDIPMVGASGAVSGILGSYLLLYPYARIKTVIFIFIFIKIVELPAVVLLTLWFFMQVLFSHTEGVAWYAHIGGFVFGILTIKMFALRKTTKRRFT